MKKKVLLSVAISLLSCQAGEAQNDLRIAVASDVHVMSPSLMQREGKAYADYMQRDRKMLKESPSLLEAFTADVLAERPQYVFITGDLTKDGERVSHEYLIAHALQRFRAAGIRVLVIPGNHDVNNPHAVAFDDASTTRVPTVSPTEFATLYRDYGYGDALARDTASLSYVYQLTPAVRVLALDACEYDRNDFAADKCYHEGYLRPATFRFAEAQLEAARWAQQKVIVIMHHGLTEHWKYQNRVLPGYVVDNAKALKKLLKRYGVHVVLTGHLHTQDITAAAADLYDVETGSLVSYASPYRLATLTADSLFIATRRLENLPAIAADFPAYCREHTAAGIRAIVGRMFPDDVPADLRREATEMVAQAMMDNYRGDERLTADKAADIDRVAKQLRKYSWKWSLVFKRVTKSLLTDLHPADETIRLKY